MLVAYTLTMPNRGSWNGGWSGEQYGYHIVKTLTNTKKNKERVDKILGNHHYSWPDGWGANVEVRIIDPAEAKKLRKASQGFCGYEWMVLNLNTYGNIRGKD